LSPKSDQLQFYNNKLFEYLGKISYSFYLWQFIVIELGKKLIKYFDDDVVMISMLFLNIFISALSYHFLEKNCRQWILDKFIKEKKQ
jgi:peptidoglycan/LPS O-acetylase OafA/YrhL